MSTLIQVHKTPANHPIVRSFGPGYKAHWRFQALQQHLIRVAQATDSAAVLNDILSAEKDPFVRQLVLFESGRPSVIAAPIEYALSCHRSRHENPFARMISAMVVAGRSSSQIAEVMGTSRAHVIAYEKIFFDVRRFLELRFWIKHLCYFPGSMTGLGEDASRRLTTALERGWNALAASFSLSRSEPISKHDPNPAGKQVVNQILLGVSARLADFLSALEMNGVTPSAAEVEPLLKIAFFARELAPTLSQLDYPTALSPSEEKKSREAAELVAGTTLSSRKKITTLIERLIFKAETGQEDQNKPSGSP